MNATDQQHRIQLLPEELVRAQPPARLGEAQERRPEHHRVMARRLGRRAERAARQARLALARAL